MYNQSNLDDGIVKLRLQAQLTGPIKIYAAPLFCPRVPSYNPSNPRYANKVVQELGYLQNRDFFLSNLLLSQIHGPFGHASITPTKQNTIVFSFLCLQNFLDASSTKIRFLECFISMQRPARKPVFSADTFARSEPVEVPASQEFLHSLPQGLIVSLQSLPLLVSIILFSPFLKTASPSLGLVLPVGSMPPSSQARHLLSHSHQPTPICPGNRHPVEGPVVAFPKH